MLMLKGACASPFGDRDPRLVVMGYECPTSSEPTKVHPHANSDRDWFRAAHVRAGRHALVGRDWWATACCGAFRVADRGAASALAHYVEANATTIEAVDER